MMPSLSRLGWTVCCLLLLSGSPSANSVEQRCSAAGSVGPRHPVQGLLEKFEAGPGCAARERGNKETHVVALGRVTNSPENKVTVLLKPLFLSVSSLRAVNLLLSSKLPVSWRLEAERLPSDLPVLVQVSSNSSVESNSLHLRVQTVHSLPFRPRVLHRWALKHHGNLSSLTHTTHGNRVYLRLGEDPTLPAACRLQSMFLSHNYMTSDLQQQEVQGCSYTGSNPEVHVIKLHSAGSGLCGSLQVEVIVSLVPPVANSKSHRVVLILSSSVPVNWAIVAHGVRGRITVHASNSVSPSYPAEPGLTVSSTLNSDLSTITDLLVWAGQSGYSKVTSYTEADLANRFVIQLAEGGTEEAVNPVVVKPPWVEERRLRQWLNGGGRAAAGGGGRGGGGAESFTVKCEDGRLSVAVDQRILQSLSVPVAAVTLQDPTCQAQSNGSHFLLVFPVISCGTEGLLLGEPRGVQYTNMFSCLAAVPDPSSHVADAKDSVNTPQTGLVPWVPEGPGSDPGLSRLPTPRHRSGPLLLLELFINESYEQKRIGPCVITADHRVYVEISAKGPPADVVQLNSCVVSPLSDPKKSPFWPVISDGCSSDPSLTLSAKKKEEAEDEAEGDCELEEEETEEVEKVHHMTERRGREAMIGKKTTRAGEEEMRPLRFSFILRPVYNNSIQFLHCSLRVCVSDPTKGELTKETVKNECQGKLHIPPLVSKSSRHQCETRNLSRPMVVTQSISSLVPKMQPPAGPRTKRLSVVPVVSSDQEHSSSAVQTGPVIGIIFAAFVMGVSLMGALWCIYSYTGSRQASAGEGPLTDQTPVSQSIWSPPSPSHQFSSSV
ncbi:transforming growth factor beta receptor type 3 isoform X2 [Amphiprion ocellaris]|uniref:ZP domain-containing protein n=1 Tax=Amphiprion ocellaris TaxID=80972 RepID=A0A3Q1CW06_AMPOC|nr:transforming growth factor beta receptor type 3 isoform X2 [Amphiprion ocellaris]